MRQAVLLIDDDPSLDSSVQEALLGAAPNAALLIARTGEEGADVLEQMLAGPTYDIALVVLDLVLPDTPGLEVLMKLRAIAESKTVPVVVVTSSEQETDIWLSYKVGANAYVVKPAGSESLVAFYRDVLHFWCTLNVRSPIYPD